MIHSIVPAEESRASRVVQGTMAASVQSQGDAMLHVNPKVLTSPQPIIGDGDPDAQLKRLGSEFAEALKVLEREHRSLRRRCKLQKTTLDDEALEALFEPATALAERMILMPARTLDGLYLKAGIVEWLYDGQIPAGETTDVAAAFSIIRDVLAIKSTMAAASACA